MIERCKGCGELVKTDEGVIDLNDDGLCDACVAKQELSQVMDAEDARALDHDHSMNG